jgi:hypothetical protein
VKCTNDYEGSAGGMELRSFFAPNPFCRVLIDGFAQPYNSAQGHVKMFKSKTPVDMILLHAFPKS